MKKLVLISIASLVVAIAIVAIADPLGVTVTTNSVTLLPKRGIRNAVQWVTNTVYSQGAYVKSDENVYMALVGGTSSNTSNDMPTHAYGVVASSCTWYRVSLDERDGFIVVNDSTNTVYLSLGSDAEANKGIRLNASGGSLTLYGYQDSVDAILGSGSGTMTATEW